MGRGKAMRAWASAEEAVFVTTMALPMGILAVSCFAYAPALALALALAPALAPAREGMLIVH
jgi:biotin-(acetyl-CoA carboxylase) ligase